MTELVVGKFGAPHGLVGWIKVQSFTQPIESILQYSPWYVQKNDEWHPTQIAESQHRGNQILVRFETYQTPEDVDILKGSTIAIHRKQLPATKHEQYYWTDLEGLEVINTQGLLLGKIEYLFSSGPHDIMVIKGEQSHLVPFIQGEFVTNVNLETKIITVNWDPLI